MKNSLLPSKNIIVNIILHSVSRLFTDLLSRGKVVEISFLDNYLQLLRELYYHQRVPPCHDLTMSKKKKSNKPFTVNNDDEDDNDNNSSSNNNVNSLECVIIAEQYLLILQNIGLLVDATGRNMELF